MGVNPKIRGKPPKMDGLFHGKPYSSFFKVTFWFPKWRSRFQPRKGHLWFQTRSLWRTWLKFMIWGYHFSWKHPYSRYSTWKLMLQPFRFDEEIFPPTWARWWPSRLLFVDLGISWILSHAQFGRNSLQHCPRCPHLNWNWKMSSSWYWLVWKGASLRCFKSRCFTIQFFIRGKMSPSLLFFFGEAVALSIFRFAVWEVNICCLPDLRKQRQCCTARSTRGYQTGVHRFAVPLGTSQVGGCGCCALGGLVPIFFVWRFFGGDVGRSFFGGKRKGYARTPPGRFIN